MTAQGTSVRNLGRTFGVITADLVESRGRSDREDTQKRLNRLVKTLNLDFVRAIRSPFMITLGDEIQGLIRDVATMPRMVQTVHDVFHPREIKIGIGIGTVSTGFSKRVVQMDGPVFVRAREAVERAKKLDREIVVGSDYERYDEVINTIYSLIGGIKRGWTSEQWTRANRYRILGTMERVGAGLHVPKQSVSKSLRNTLATRVHDAENLLLRLFAEFYAAGLRETQTGG